MTIRCFGCRPHTVAIRGSRLFDRCPFGTQVVLLDRCRDFRRVQAQTAFVYDALQYLTGVAMLAKAPVILPLTMYCFAPPLALAPRGYARRLRDFCHAYSPDIALLNKVQVLGLTVLPKPYVPRDLARRVREILDPARRKFNMPR